MKNKPIVVAIAGKAFAGKDTVAEFMIRDLTNLGLTCAHISHADAIRKIMTEVLYYTKEQVTDQKLKIIKVPMWDKSPRESMILIGTELFRNNFDPDTWVKLLKARIENATEDVIFVTDCRFINEIENMQDLDATIIHVDRDPFYMTQLYDMLRRVMAKNQWLYRILKWFKLVSFRWHLSELLDIKKYETEHVYNDSDIVALEVACKIQSAKIKNKSRS